MPNLRAPLEKRPKFFMSVIGDITINHSKRNYFLLFTFIASTVCIDGCRLFFFLFLKKKCHFHLKEMRDVPWENLNLCSQWNIFEELRACSGRNQPLYFLLLLVINSAQREKRSYWCTLSLQNLSHIFLNKKWTVDQLGSCRYLTKFVVWHCQHNWLFLQLFLKNNLTLSLVIWLSNTYKFCFDS